MESKEIVIRIESASDDMNLDNISLSSENPSLPEKNPEKIQKTR